MPLKRNKTVSSTGTPSSAGNGAQSPRPAESPSWRLFTTLDTLPLDNFIRCIVDEDLAALIMEAAGPVPPVMALRKQWADAPEGAEIVRLERRQAHLRALITNAQGPGAADSVLRWMEEDRQLDDKVDILSERLAMIKTALDAAEGQLALIVGSTWSQLFMDYLDLNKHNKARYRFSVERDIAILSARLQQIETCIGVLRTFYHYELADHLRQMDEEFASFEFNPADQNEYQSDLNAVWDRSREIRIDKELKEMELEEIKESDRLAPLKKATHQSFVNILARIATFRKVAVIRTSELTVAEFVAAFNEYLDACKALEAPKHRKT